MEKDIPVFIINLRNEGNKLKKCIKNLELLGLNNIEVIRAIDENIAQELRHSYFDYMVQDNIEKGPYSTLIIPTWGAAGCAISHYRCWEIIIEKNIGNAIIVEDDIFIKNIDLAKYKIAQALTIYEKHNFDYELPDIEKYKISPLMVLFDTLCGRDSREKIRHDTYRIKNAFLNTHFYFTNKEMCSFMINKIKPIIYQIDIQIGMLSNKYRHLNIYTIENTGIDAKKNKPESKCQYYFIKLNELINALKLPDNICRNIDKYMVKKLRYNKVYFDLSKKCNLLENNNKDTIGDEMNSIPFEYNLNSNLDYTGISYYQGEGYDSNTLSTIIYNGNSENIGDTFMVDYDDGDTHL